MEPFQLHGPTVQLITALLIVVLTLVMLMIWRLYPKVPGIRSWALASVAALMVAVLAFGRNSNPSLLNLGLSNMAILLVAALIWCGCRDYVGRPVSCARALLPLVGIAAVLIVLLEAFGFPVWMRLSFQGLVVGVLYLMAALVLFKQEGLRRATPNFFIVAASLHAAFLILLRPWLMHRHIDSGAATIIPPLVSLEAIVFFLMITIVLIMLVTEHVNRQLTVLSEIDGLTGVFNRRTFLRLLDKAKARSERSGEPLGLIALDLDHFKLVNDQFGHPCGDQVLRSFAACAQLNLRTQDVIGRIGGEEFAIFLPDTPFKDAKVIAQRLRQSCESDAVRCAQQVVRYTISIGLTMLQAGENKQAALSRADKAMYEAKRTGRNRCIAVQRDSEQPVALAGGSQAQTAAAPLAGA